MDQKNRLLIVDDELLIRDLLYDHFSACDYQVSLAADGGSALEKSAGKEYDAVILDLKMPDMDGLELATQLRENQTAVPIIIITGYPSVDSAVEALRNRYHDYFVKPFNMKKLEKAVREAVALYRQTAQGTGEKQSD